MPQKILVVEDDKFLRELISRKLVSAGYEVEGAVDGEEGVNSARAEKPALILLDLILPGIDGFEALRRIRQSPEIGKIPVIILSNLGQKEDIDRGLQLGATDYLIKARFTPGEIVDKIAAILGAKS
jgi:DNA-binding response OmpR family regulator